ncbi:hypothetical protein ABW20_dc0106708 [Dactylellina cionopaga]|nr:hypothetical protein ABW20_dc0106708 [Dactylellina cionopaga]
MIGVDSEIASPGSTSKGSITDPTTISGPIPPAYPLSQNDLAHLIEYRHNSLGQLSSYSRVSLPRGLHFCYIKTQTPAPRTTWSTVQTSKTDHIELNSALLYTNHSCAPTLEIEVYSPNSKGEYPNGMAGEVRVVKDRDLQAGDELTWFYPSTEYMSPRPFTCLCGASDDVCIGTQKGSHFLPKSVLDRYFINTHVRELVAERDSTTERISTEGFGGLD